MESIIDPNWVRPYLSGDEYLLWSGKPCKGRLLVKSDIFMIPFSIVWCGFAVFWEYSAVRGGVPLPFALFGIPFVVMGLYITIGRFFHKAYLRKRTAYAITNRRVLRLQGRKVDTLSGDALSRMRISENRDGSGTITFGDSFRYGRGYAPSQPGGFPFALENIEDVNRVQQLLQRMDK